MNAFAGILPVASTCGPFAHVDEGAVGAEGDLRLTLLGDEVFRVLALESLAESFEERVRLLRLTGR